MLGQGEYSKKTKNNNSYYKRYTGKFCDGYPQGEDSSLEIKLSQWPRYHALMSKFGAPQKTMSRSWCVCKRKRTNVVVAAKSDIYKRSVVYKGEFKNGNLEGNCDVIVTDKMLDGKIE